MSRKQRGRFDEFLREARPPDSGAAQPPTTPRARATDKPRAKRDDPDYKQALAYVRRETHRSVMAKLAEQEREFSDLVEELLSKWLKANS